MGDDLDDRDAVSPDYSVALLARYPLARLGRQFAPVDADDCAPWCRRRHPSALRVALCPRPPHRWWMNDRDGMGSRLVVPQPPRLNDLNDCAAGLALNPSLGDSP